jgi:hypothetical protein
MKLNGIAVLWLKIEVTTWFGFVINNNTILYKNGEKLDEPRSCDGRTFVNFLTKLVVWFRNNYSIFTSFIKSCFCIIYEIFMRNGRNNFPSTIDVLFSGIIFSPQQNRTLHILHPFNPRIEHVYKNITQCNCMLKRFVHS